MEPPQAQPGPDTQNVTLTFGKHKGEVIRKVPRHYLHFMVNENTPQSEYARAELERRGDTMPSVELSGHAIDSASLRVWKNWQESRRVNEGLYSWLQRITLEATERGERTEDGKIKYLGMKLVIEKGEVYPVLKTIMP